LNHTIPFELGGGFATLTYTAQAWARGDFSEGGGEGVVHGDYQFRFFEADGVTPVDFSDAPEPSTVGLFGLAAVLLCCTYRQRKLTAIKRQ
jgi:hypothetical protein